MLAYRTETFTDAYQYLFDAIMKHGIIRSPRGKTTKDLSDVVVLVNNPKSRIIKDRNRKAYVRPALAEFAWYMTANPAVDIITPHLPKWSMFSDDGINVNSNYGTVWRKEIPKIIKLLTEDPHSRRAVMQIYDNRFLEYRGKDTPCTTSMTFYIEDSKLCVSVQMRSNDLVYGSSAADWFTFSLLQELVANELSLPLGHYVHHAVSLHVYEEFFDMQLDKNYDVATDLQELDNDIQLNTYTNYTNFWFTNDPYVWSNPRVSKDLNKSMFVSKVIL